MITHIKVPMKDTEGKVQNNTRHLIPKCWQKQTDNWNTVEIQNTRLTIHVQRPLKPPNRCRHTNLIVRNYKREEVQLCKTRLSGESGNKLIYLFIYSLCQTLTLMCQSVLECLHLELRNYELRFVLVINGRLPSQFKENNFRGC